MSENALTALRETLDRFGIPRDRADQIILTEGPKVAGQDPQAVRLAYGSFAAQERERTIEAEKQALVANHKATLDNITARQAADRQALEAEAAAVQSKLATAEADAAARQAEADQQARFAAAKALVGGAIHVGAGPSKLSSASFLNPNRR